MRIRRPVGHFSILTFTAFLWLATGVVRSQTGPPAQATESASVASPQLLRDQHAELIRAIELIRRDADTNLQRYAAGIERIRKETEASLRRLAAGMDTKVELLTQAFASERERELQVLQESNRFALASAGIMTGLLLLGIVFVGWISVRAVNRLAGNMARPERSTSALKPAALESQAALQLTGTTVQETRMRLQNAIDRLERRLLDLEQTANPFPAAAQTTPLSAARTPVLPSGSKSTAVRLAKTTGVSLTLGEGESLIFLPHENGDDRFRTWRSFRQKMSKWLPLARDAKGD